jgi:hypothetical protein
MNPKDYIKDKIIFIVSIASVSIILAVFVYVLGNGVYAAFYAFLILILSQTTALILEYFHKKEFYYKLLKNLDKLDKKYFLSEMIDKPSFLEGEILYETVKQTNKSMNDEIATYTSAMKEYKEYVETWVHEIKTPISSSKLIIENDKNSTTMNLYGELIKIENYVDQALFYARSNNVEKDYLIKKTTLKELVNSVLKKNARTFIESKISFEISALDKVIYTDVKWTDFIIGQILMNSVKYRSQEPKIRIMGLNNENSATLLISDNGIGISKKDLKRVFEKGFTGENGRKIAKSTGIGLYLCKKLCDKMNLGISVASNENCGTTISIVFPKSNMFV